MESAKVDLNRDVEYLLVSYHVLVTSSHWRKLDTGSNSFWVSSILHSASSAHWPPFFLSSILSSPFSILLPSEGSLQEAEIEHNSRWSIINTTQPCPFWHDTLIKIDILARYSSQNRHCIFLNFGTI